MINVNKLNFNNAKAVSELHYIAFKNFFLTSLGKPFLLAFYKAIMKHPDGIAIGLYDNAQLLGFAVGTKRNEGFYASLLYHNWFKLGLAALPSLILNPLKIGRLFLSFETSRNTNQKCMPSLLSICVSPNNSSKGLGSILLQEFERELLKNDLDELVLTTNTNDNDNANIFYLKNNYNLTDSFFQGKREMNLYYKKLTK